VEVSEEALADLFVVLSPHLNERQRRLLAGAQARALGRGGVAAVARVSGMSRSTVSTGAGEVDEGPELTDRVRRPGAGRPRIEDRDPGLVDALDALVEPTARGDPESPLRWTCKSTRNLADALTKAGHPISAQVVAELLAALGYSLQATSKQVEGSAHPDRNAQFDYINDLAAEHLDAAQPVISVDTKKKELVGNYANGGREWQPSGEPVRVDVHDFPDPAVGKAIPYGVYDLAADEGWVSVGSDHDTAAFAVATIGRWWDMVGSVAYPKAKRLLITADAGGSNSYRSRLWKVELAKLAAEAGLNITICHFPPGTSKWNKIEHRLFSHISTNWRGHPLTSHEVVVDLIAGTKTRTGLKVRAELDRATYPKGIVVSDEQLTAVPLNSHDWHGDWNYTITGRRTRRTHSRSTTTRA
jgi:Rhodopirellula transposase DDE domain